VVLFLTSKKRIGENPGTTRYGKIIGKKDRKEIAENEKDTSGGQSARQKQSRGNVGRRTLKVLESRKDITKRKKKENRGRKGNCTDWLELNCRQRADARVQSENVTWGNEEPGKRRRGVAKS